MPPTQLWGDGTCSISLLLKSGEKTNTRRDYSSHARNINSLDDEKIAWYEVPVKQFELPPAEGYARLSAWLVCHKNMKLLLFLRIGAASRWIFAGPV